jgi:hypothetical protein
MPVVHTPVGSHASCSTYQLIHMPGPLADAFLAIFSEWANVTVYCLRSAVFHCACQSRLTTTSDLRRIPNYVLGNPRRGPESTPIATRHAFATFASMTNLTTKTSTYACNFVALHTHVTQGRFCNTAPPHAPSRSAFACRSKNSATHVDLPPKSAFEDLEHCVGSLWPAQWKRVDRASFGPHMAW